MSPIKSQTMFERVLAETKARYDAHIMALMNGQAEFKKAAALIERLNYLGETELDLNAHYLSEKLDLVAYAHHCRSQEQAVFDACVATGLPFSISASHSDELRNLIFDGCALRIVFRDVIVASLQVAA